VGETVSPKVDRLLIARRANRAYASCVNCPSCHCAAGGRYCSKPQISSIFRVSRSHKRGVSRSSRTLGAGCGGRGGVARRAALKRTAKSCGSGAPKQALRSRRCSRVLRVTVATKRWSPRRARITRKTIAQGMPVDPALPVVTAACFFCCRRAMGEVVTRHSLRPLHFGGTSSRHNSGAARGENAGLCPLAA
jgi:hypothetical protein